MTGNYETLSIRRDGRLVRLELARPERLNAVAMTGAREMADAASPDRSRTRVVGVETAITRSSGGA